MLCERSHHVGDDLAGFFHLDAIVNPDVFLADLPIIMERGVCHRGPREHDGFHCGTGRDLASLADLVRHSNERGDPAFSGELERDEPPRAFGSRSQAGVMPE